MRFTIPANVIRAVELFAAKADVRFYLNGTYVRALDADTLQLVATNGSILAQYRHTRDATADEPYRPNESYILPVGLTTGIKLTRHVPCVTVTASATQWTVDYIGSQRNGVPIDGQFPDVERIWPTQIGLTPGHFDFQYFALMQQACKLLGVKSPLLFQNGPQKSSLFSIGPLFAGVLMPLRPHEELPGWCQTTLTSLDTRLTTRLAHAQADDAASPQQAYGLCVDAVAEALDIKRETFAAHVKAEAALLRATRAAAQDRAKALAAPPQRAAAKRKRGPAEKISVVA